MTEQEKENVARAAAKKAADGKRMFSGARLAAQADKSDPFFFARAVTHIDVGVATVIRGEHSRDYDLDRAMTAHYDAKPYTYERLIPGLGKVPTVGYQSITRP